MSYNLPRAYLSYSAWDLWKRDKQGFRRRYYLNEPSFETAETIFGKTVHETLSPDGEERIEVWLTPDLKLLGYLDDFDVETLAITDYKTGHLSPKGEVPWNNVKVRRHKQFPFYCLLVKLRHGTYNPNVVLQWLETKFKTGEVEFDGHTLVAPTRELELTGRVEIFNRVIEDWEIDKLTEEILLAAKEITEDYTLWQNQQKETLAK